MSGSMASFARAVSGMQAAQAGLYVTGHNVSNVTTTGYTRQRTIQADFSSQTIGFSGLDNMQVGLGVDIQSIQQIRDQFLDRAYRNETSRVNYYDIRAEVVNEIEAIFGEIQGSGRLSDSMDNLWHALQELSNHPNGTETRALFVSSAKAFIDKANDIQATLFEYQITLNEEIISQTKRINQITNQIRDLNDKIALNEVSGDNANDYRDTRNLLLDELSTYGDVQYREDSHGRMNVLLEGHDLVINGFVNQVGLRYTAPGYPFVEPVFTTSTEILDYDPNSPCERLYNDVGKVISAGKENDYGSLKSLLVARGVAPANYTTSESEVSNYIIPKVQREYDILINKIVTMFNDAFAPKDALDPLADPPKDLNGEFGNELFIRKKVSRYDSDGNFIEEDPNDHLTLYSAGNVVINPDILNDYNLLALSVTGDVGDNSLVEDLLQKFTSGSWKDEDGNTVQNPYAPRVNAFDTPSSFKTFYNTLVTKLGQIGKEAQSFVVSETTLITKLENNRQAISGVSLDEEMSSMLKYQHAYNASAKMVNVIDSMLDRIINQTGRVGR